MHYRMINFVENYCAAPSALRRPMWRIWHNLLIRFDKDTAVNFMNYGYASLNGDPKPELEKEDEANRYCIQLYDHVVNKSDLADKNVLEVGSGRGGGAHYITRYYKPASYTGVDISSGVINFCNRFYQEPGLDFKEGRAEKLPVEDEAYHAVVNVESARCYGDLMAFFNEVYRVLKPEGEFLFADMIATKEVSEIREKLNQTGFRIVEERNITPNVSKGLELDNQRREKLIRQKVPGMLKKSFNSFAGTKGSRRFESFRDGTFEYRSFIIRKK